MRQETAAGLIIIASLLSACEPIKQQNENSSGALSVPQPSVVTPETPTPIHINLFERISTLEIRELEKLQRAYEDYHSLPVDADLVITLCEALPTLPTPETTRELVWPTYGPMFQYFGPYHKGIDISPPFGTPVEAVNDGIVVVSFKSDDWWGWSLGKHVAIYHNDGQMLSVYGHFSSVNVQIGDRVKKGEVIGRVGSTGQSNGPHLHFGVIEKTEDSCKWINPLKVLP